MNRIKNCYNCGEFQMHPRGILCQRDATVRDKEGALLGCKFYKPAQAPKEGPSCISCENLVSRRGKWLCTSRDSILGGEEINPDEAVCGQYKPVEPVEPELTDFAKELRAVLEDDLKALLEDDFAFLLDKNKQYGDSALNPLRIFSRADPKEQLFVRMDDKLSRIKRGDSTTEDTFKDLRNYMNLLEVLVRREKKAQES